MHQRTKKRSTADGAIIARLEVPMHALALAIAFVMLSSAAWAQQPTLQDAAQAAKLFASSTNIAALVAKAKSDRKPDQPNFVQPIVQRGTPSTSSTGSQG
jgi:hypothetical protein